MSATKATIIDNDCVRRREQQQKRRSRRLFSTTNCHCNRDMKQAKVEEREHKEHRHDPVISPTRYLYCASPTLACECSVCCIYLLYCFHFLCCLRCCCCLLFSVICCARLEARGDGKHLKTELTTRLVSAYILC